MSIVFRPPSCGHGRRDGRDVAAALDGPVAVGDLHEGPRAGEQRLGPPRKRPPGPPGAPSPSGSAVSCWARCCSSLSTEARPWRWIAAISTMPASSPISATAASAASVTRARRLRGAPHGRSTHPTPRTVCSDARLALGLELAAQVADEHVDHVGLDLGRVAPDVAEQLVAREHLAGMARERLEQLELAPRELEVAPVAGGDVAARRRRRRRRSRSGPAPSEPRRRSSACSRAVSSAQRERLDQVVVGAGLQAGDAVLDLVARGEDADGDVDARRRAAAARPPTPSRSGIATSSTITAGGRCAIAASASRPPAAVPDGEALERSARSREWRTEASSSTTSTRGSGAALKDLRRSNRFPEV